MAFSALTDLMTRPGTSQAQRLAATPDPGGLRLDERSEADLRAWAAGLAKQLNFFNEKNGVTGTWETFFAPDEATLAELRSRGEVPPHYALFLAFLKLFGWAREHFNGLTKRHLDFYYEQILGLARSEGQPDVVYAVVELARQATEVLLPQGTVLDGGKGPDGQPRRLRTTLDAVVNQACVAVQRSIFGQNGTLHAGEPREGRVFGGADLSPVQPGFALASPALQLAGGERTVTVEITLSQPLALRRWALLALFEGSLSGEKAWLPLNLTPRLTGNRLVLTGTLPAREKAVVGWSAALPGEAFPTAWPVLRVRIPASAYGFWRQARVESLRLRVDVRGAAGLRAENDLGPVDPRKAFQPFGPQPVPGSAFILSGEELRTKTLDRLDLQLTWLNPPPRLGAHYRHYPGWKSLTNASFGATLRVDGAVGQPVALFDPNDATRSVTLTWTGNQPDVDQIRLENGQSFYHREFPPLYARTMLEKATEATKPTPAPAAKAAPSLPPAVRVDETRTVKQLLPTAFQLDKVARVDQFVSLADLLDDGIPNEPYTPTLQSLRVDYTASSQPGELRFFHLDADGFYENETPNGPLLPQHTDEGQWLIGLENTQPGQALSLLIQVRDGTADPDTTPPAVTWSVLAGNDWLRLDERHLLGDETGGLLQSGLLRLNPPDAAFAPHTRLNPGMLWLRASVAAGSGGVCRVAGVFASALRAVGEGPGAIPAGSVAKLLPPQATVKGLSQPYASGGGQPAEDDGAFYRRVSERLRHKGRAASIWDYEHLVLQAFPELHQVKCLPHTAADCESCPTPGAVTLVLVPRTDPNDPLRPRASQGLRARVQRFVNQCNGLFVKAEAMNALFETVRVEAKLRLQPGLPFGFFRDQLNDDLVRYLSPWAFGGGTDLPFGGSLRRSALLNFLENRPTVDVVTELRVFVGNREITDTDVLTASGPRAILVSADRHTFTNLNEP
jgi:hypothetical protein